MISTDKALLAFTSVFVSSALWPKLPHVSLIIIGAVLVIFCIYFSLSAILSGALLGFIWAASMGHWYTSWQLNAEIFNQNVMIEGEIRSIMSFTDEPTELNSTTQNPAAIRVNIAIDVLGQNKLFHSPTVRLSWYRPLFLPKQGQRVRLLVNLKAPSGLANPHTFHYQTWLASKNIVATGNVIESDSNQLLIDEVSIRQNSIDSFSEMNLQHSAWLQALSFGYRGELNDDDWELLQKSGTAHLFAISGLHVGIVFAYCMLLLSKPLSVGLGYFRLKQYQMSKVSGFFATMICLVYAYLAGLEVPVLRAILALILWTYLLLSASHWRLTAVFLYLLTGFFILFPFSILGVSFWFSFSAVLSIWVFAWRLLPKAKLNLFKKLKYTFYLQIWLSLITMPLTIYIFGYLPVFAVFANLLLVPWVSFVLIPLCLIGAFSMLLGLPHAAVLSVFSLADRAVSVTLIVMEKTVALSDALITSSVSLDGVSLLVIMFLVVIAIVPFWRFKKRLICFGVCLIFARVQASPDLNPTLTIFDVGQGSAALLRFKNSDSVKQAWLFDTGARFPSGFSMAQAVILPNLKHHGIRRLDALFLSHLDNDHAGGVNVLAAELNIDKVLSPPNVCNVTGSKQQRFESVNINMQILWPKAPVSGDENNHSCVIKLTIGEQRIIFAGDIERQAESALVSLYEGTDALDADILIAPHHGSRTSSTDAFVQAVSAKHVVFSAAHPNRWGFPHDDVIARYRENGSQIFDTGKQGAIEFEFIPERTIVQTYREDMHNRWYFKAPN